MDTGLLFAQSGSGGDAAAGVAAVGFSLFFMIFWLIIMALSVGSVVLWIISLVHVIQHQDVKDRVLWIVILLVAGSIGGVIYIFAVKRPYDRGGMRELPPQAPLS